MIHFYHRQTRSNLTLQAYQELVENLEINPTEILESYVFLESFREKHVDHQLILVPDSEFFRSLRQDQLHQPIHGLLKMMKIKNFVKIKKSFFKAQDLYVNQFVFAE
jgi:hypothetical protein